MKNTVDVISEVILKENEVKPKSFWIKFLLIIIISPFFFFMLHELFHIIVGYLFGIKIEIFSIEIRSGLPFFVIHFAETNSSLIDLFVYMAGSVGMILFGFCFLIYGILKGKGFIYYFGCLAIQQDVFFIGLSCIINEGDWSSVFTILGFNYNIYFVIGILFFIFFIIIYVIELYGILKYC